MTQDLVDRLHGILYEIRRREMVDIALYGADVVEAFDQYTSDIFLFGPQASPSPNEKTTK